MSNRFDLFKRGIELQYVKIELLWDMVQDGADIIEQFANDIPDDLIKTYGSRLYKFLQEYRLLVGKRGLDEQEENEQN